MSFAHAVSQPTYNDRRIDLRHSAMTALSIDDEERVQRAGVTVNLSASGMLFRSQEPLAIGTPVQLSFPSPRVDGESVRVTGVVVRDAGHMDYRDTLFPHLAAVQFNERLAIQDLPAKTKLLYLT